MTITIHELSEAEDVRNLKPLVTEYFEVVMTGLAGFGISIPVSVPVDDMMQNLDLFVPPKGRAYLADVGGETKGMAFLKPLAGDKIELKRLYVTPDTRGTGLGRKLLHHTIEAARALGKREMLLDTITPLEAAIALYEREGFRRIAPYQGSEIARYEEVLPHAVFMAKSL